MNALQGLLIFATVGLVPIALSYGVAPRLSMNYLFEISVPQINDAHIFRAVMGLYLGFAVFWAVGALNVQLRQAALYSLVVFMLGLAAGRLLSLIVDGVPHWLLIVYLLLELGIGLLGALVLNRAD